MRKLANILAQRAKDEADDRDLRSRTDAKKERKDREESLAVLAEQLTALSSKELGRLELPEALADAIRDARAIHSPVARARQLRIVRRELRECDGQLVRDLSRATGSKRERAQAAREGALRSPATRAPTR